jgi:hypothetical protein
MQAGRSGRRRAVAVICLVLAVALIAAAALVATNLSTPTAAPHPGSSADAGPVYAPARPGGSTAKVFAHYFPPYPISLDNKPPGSDYYARQYLDPDGEGGAHAAYGGLLRDRPLGREPETGDWKTTDLEREVRQAAGVGIDGFTVDVLSYSGENWDQTLRLERAAERVHNGFVVVPNLDMTTSSGKSELQLTAEKLVQLFRSPAAYRLADGRYALSTFKAEARSPDWWRQLESVMSERYGIRLALISVLLDASDAQLRAYAPVSYMLSSWGVRDVASLARVADEAALAHRLGVRWMEPVAVQDDRPRAGAYAESDNTGLLRSGWKQAIDGHADAVQLVTWNDYSEGTQVAPSVSHGTVFLEICAYYVDWFKAGNPPRIQGDALYVTFRTQPAQALPSGGQTLLMSPTLGGALTGPRNEVEVLTFLERPADVTVAVGGGSTRYRAPAGVGVRLVPLRPGRVTAELARGGRGELVVAPHVKVVSRPVVQNLDYHAAGATTGRAR